MVYRYRAEVLQALTRHGVTPRTTTSPETIREFLSDLYRFEIRALRSRLLAREFPKDRYALEVVELRKKYALLSLPVQLWTETGGGE